MYISMSEEFAVSFRIFQQENFRKIVGNFEAYEIGCIKNLFMF